MMPNEDGSISAQCAPDFARLIDMLSLYLYGEHEIVYVIAIVPGFAFPVKLGFL